MTRRAPCLVAIGIIAVTTPSPCSPGVFVKVLKCSTIVAGFCAQGTDVNSDPIGPQAIVHPPGYDGTTAILQVDVCVHEPPGLPSLVTATQLAIAKWASQVATVGNCAPYCTLPEDPGVGGIFDAETVIFHELGHALGLGHPNLFFRDPLVGVEVHTSFSAAHTGSPIGVDVGIDGVRGSRDDYLAAPGGIAAVNVHWFREDTNNPFLPDMATIDLDNFSRSTNLDLPLGSTWAANANYCHGYQAG